MGKLTQEQLERARDAYNAVIVQDDTTTAQALEAAAPHLQYAHEAPEDVVEAMKKVFAEHKCTGNANTFWTQKMNAVFHVCAAWCRERMLAVDTVTPADRWIWDECWKADKDDSDSFPRDKGFRSLERFLIHRRSQPLLPAKTVEETLRENVYAILSGTGSDAEHYTDQIVGLIEHLKREGR